MFRWQSVFQGTRNAHCLVMRAQALSKCWPLRSCRQTIAQNELVCIDYHMAYWKSTCVQVVTRLHGDRDAQRMLMGEQALSKGRPFVRSNANGRLDLRAVQASQKDMGHLVLLYRH